MKKIFSTFLLLTLAINSNIPALCNTNIENNDYTQTQSNYTIETLNDENMPPLTNSSNYTNSETIDNSTNTNDTTDQTEKSDNDKSIVKKIGEVTVGAIAVIGAIAIGAVVVCGYILLNDAFEDDDDDDYDYKRHHRHRHKHR